MPVILHRQPVFPVFQRIPAMPQFQKSSAAGPATAPDSVPVISAKAMASHLVDRNIPMDFGGGRGGQTLVPHFKKRTYPKIKVHEQV